ncbi:MAG: hypothetical protein K8S87_05460 [Planctomycetes bacterium]|nr:hypothetical protein [Planctomycetota bacterium]
MKFEEIIDIYRNYKVIKDSIKVTRRSIVKDVPNLHQRTEFEGKKADAANELATEAHSALDDLIVLSLFATYERELRAEIKAIVNHINDYPHKKLGKKILAHTMKEIEYWSFADILDMFKFSVDKETRGKLKQIADYRNWVAHGKSPKKLPAAKTEPKTTFEAIMEFIYQIETYNKNLKDDFLFYLFESE